MAKKTISGVSIPDDWAQYSTQKSDEFEFVHDPMWDTRTYTDNATLNLNFFTATGAGATPDLTSKVFPLTDSFLLKAIGVFFKIRPFTDDAGAAGAFPSIWGDLAQLINTGVLNLTIGKKNYGPFPLWKLGAGGGLFGVMCTAGAEAANLVHDYAQLGSPQTDALFKLQVPLLIPAQTQVPVSMSWAAAINTANGDISTCLYFDGITARSVQ